MSTAIGLLTGGKTDRAASSSRSPLDMAMAMAGRETEFAKALRNAPKAGGVQAADEATFSEAALAADATAEPKAKDKDDDKLKETFREFVGSSVFGQLMSAMRKTVGETPYFHGGRGEEVFQAQLDQELTKSLTAASADRLADPLFELFQLQSQG